MATARNIVFIGLELESCYSVEGNQALGGDFSRRGMNKFLGSVGTFPHPPKKGRENSAECN